MCLLPSSQNVFITGEGQAGALAELEKRKFTAEEGVNPPLSPLSSSPSLTLFLSRLQDHLTLLNGTHLPPSPFASSKHLTDRSPLMPVYNGFTKYGSSSSKWCSIHRLNFKALSRAVSIRQQLKKYLLRFGKQPVRIESCEGDHERLRRCLGAFATLTLLRVSFLLLTPMVSFVDCSDWLLQERSSVGRGRGDVQEREGECCEPSPSSLPTIFSHFLFPSLILSFFSPSLRSPDPPCPPLLGPVHSQAVD